MNDFLIWRPIERAPRDGRGFLAFGVHRDPVPAGAGRNVQPGDYWWAILVFDVWRQQKQFVFAKDGAAPWSEPLAWAELRVPFSVVDPAMLGLEMRAAESIGLDIGLGPEASV